MAITASLKSKPSSLYRALRVYQIYGANTNVGKTIMSTILCKAFALQYPNQKTWYLKPVSTGPLADADDRHVSRFSSQTKTLCLFQFDEAVSPHIAARSISLPDNELLHGVQKHLASCAQSGDGTLILETAGGVHSPAPSGSSQADLYRPLRLPVCLVADHRLGGISATISAYESLHIRGYDLDAVLQFEDESYKNHTYLRDYFEKRGILTLSLPQPPEHSASEEDDFERMSAFYNSTSKLDVVEEMITELNEKQETRLQRLEEMSSEAYKHIWYPFTQHQDISPKTIMTIDSAYGDFFQTLTTKTSNEAPNAGILEPTFDGSASWWTQGIGHGNPIFSLSAAYAASRYGHVMFAGAIHEPALKLASNLLRHLQNPRLQKVFFSDNGSTGMEVAMKMALTAATERYKWNVEKGDVEILGLRGSYHGDTIGAMDASECSEFNERVHWYRGRGYWFDFPRVKMKDGCWIVESQSEMIEHFGEVLRFSSLDEIFDIKKRLDSEAATKYRRFIEAELKRLVQEEGRTFGALVMEPVILGAGGMLFADPLFQHLLVQTIRTNTSLFCKSPSTQPSSPTPTDPQTWTGLPIIHDEVFTGLYRLGRFSSSSLLQLHPDISCHAKLLTGGLLPLCTTIASNSIYAAFLGKEKKDALLHGHSYTAHAIGCEVANTALGIMVGMEREGKWEVHGDDWGGGTGISKSLASIERNEEVQRVWSVWSKNFVERVSMAKEVESVIALGSVLAISLHDEEQAGYSSSAAVGLQKNLAEQSEPFKIHSRVLGNVFYLMASLTSERETLLAIERVLLKALA